MAKEGERLLMFSGTECEHCKDMYPLLDQLEKEAGLKVEMIEVWHNAKNAAWLESLDKDEDGNVLCGGIPFFYNEKTGKKICGNMSYEKLKKWASGTL